ncbi:hypothetical protein OA492_03120, partial [Pelagibacteraceae bacterium]|nr:hypothetical protein [Pelagibacteraceae bacterium]
MKIDPIDLLLNPDIKLIGNVYFVSGNEKTLMAKIKDLIIFNLSKNNLLEIQKIKNINSIDNNISLFNKNRLFVVNETDGLDKDIFSLFDNNNFFIFISENS